MTDTGTDTECCKLELYEDYVNNTLFIENEDGNANLIATVCVYVLLF